MLKKDIFGAEDKSSKHLKSEETTKIRRVWREEQIHRLGTGDSGNYR